MNYNRDEDSISECTSDQEAPPQLQRPKIDRLLKEKVNLKKVIMNVALTQYPVVSEVARELGWSIQQDKEAGDWDICWTDYTIEPSILIRMHFHQKINHFPGIHLIARKNLLGESLMNMKALLPDEFQFFPSTWMLPSQYSEFRAYYQTTKQGKVRTYIVKPQADCQGRGIFLTRNIRDLENGRHYVIQRYITKPYLLDGLKFDLRIYVLLAGSPLRAYIYEEGLARLATIPYEQPDSSNMDNMCIHLTNYAINKLNPNFVFNTSARDMGIGHKRSLTSIYKLLEKKGQDVRALKAKINQIIVKTILTAMPSIDHQYRHCQPEEYSGNMCFHLLGFDVMMNEKLEPFLIQVNHTPSFATDTPLDLNIKSRLIKDSLILMNINTKTKKSLFNKAQQYNHERLLTGKRQIYHQGTKPKEFIEAQQDRDAYQKLNLGGFQKIHPVQDPALQQKYDRIYSACSKINFQRDSMSFKLQDKQKDGRGLRQYLRGPPKRSFSQKQQKVQRVQKMEKKLNDLDMARSRHIYNSDKKPTEGFSLSRVHKQFSIIKEVVLKQSLCKITVVKTNLSSVGTSKETDLGAQQARMVDSDVMMPYSRKNLRLVSLKQKKSSKNDEEAKRNYYKSGNFVTPKVFSLTLEQQKKISSQ